MLTCDPEPIVPAVVATDDDGAQWAEMVRSAGANRSSKRSASM
jgi:hypothetical protein